MHRFAGNVAAGIGDQLGDGDGLAAEGKGAGFGGLANDGGRNAQLAGAGEDLIGAVGGGGHEHAGGGLGEGRGKGVLVHGGEIEVEAEAGGIGKRTGALGHLKGGDGKAALGDIVRRGEQLIAVEELGQALFVGHVYLRRQAVEGGSLGGIGAHLLPDGATALVLGFT